MATTETRPLALVTARGARVEPVGIDLGRAGRLMPDSVKARMHREQARPGSES